jgi:transcriptional regulator with XRE-family HTH domain
MEQLRTLRQEAGMSVRALAREAQVDPATISLVENGHRDPSLATLEKLAGGLGIELADFFPKVQAPLFDLPPEQRGVAEAAFPWVEAIFETVGRWRALAADPEWPDDKPIYGLVDAAIELSASVLARVRTQEFRALPAEAQEHICAAVMALADFGQWALAQTAEGGEEHDRRRQQIHELTMRLAS